MKKLGRIFKNKFVLIVSFLLVFILVGLKLIGVFRGKYDKIAYGVYLSMYRLGTREAELFSLLEGLKSWELELVYKSFGTRGYGMMGGDEIFGKQLNLFEWFEKELTGKEKEKMRRIWEVTKLEITF